MLASPIFMTDNVGAVAWDVIYKPFGEVNNVAIISAATDLRFPGQWFQLESGLHYNWHRHYDPTTGRYIQPDPLQAHRVHVQNATRKKETLSDRLIGLFHDMGRGGSSHPKRAILDDGPSIYGYVEQSPLTAVDPSGLTKTDQWYGFNNKKFQKWCHRQVKKPGDADFTKEEIKELFEEWLNLNMPGPEKK